MVGGGVSTNLTNVFKSSVFFLKSPLIRNVVPFDKSRMSEEIIRMNNGSNWDLQFSSYVTIVGILEF